jgi:hypothetical protein
LSKEAEFSLVLVEVLQGHIVPMLKRLGKIWYYIGIAGTIILIIMWVVTRVLDNPITGRGGPISEMTIVIEIFKIAYIALTAIIIVKESNKKVTQTIKEREENIDSKYYQYNQF